ncbi:hypothetical protein B0J14DRAFT_630849 [Halenospora varia]|nr:hypothetical protein B0J14DRAFT_630849 [Halenospora varia]
MPAAWEEIPLVGPVLGNLANTSEYIINGAAGWTGQGANVMADVLIGKERKERIVTEVPTWLVENISDKSKIIHSAKEIVEMASEEALRKLVTAFSKRLPGLIAVISPMIQLPVTGQVDEVIRGSLNLISSAADLVSPELLLVTLLKLSKTVLRAVLAKVGQLSIIETAIFSNDLNVATLGLIWRNGAELAGFFVDMAKCIKCYASTTSLDGRDGQNGSHGQDNELDLSQAMNRHALTCQIQRFAKSMIFILTGMANPTVFSSINMTTKTTLKSDLHVSGTVLEVKPSGWQRVVDPASPEKWPEIQEKWLFVNGVATELFGLHLACKKLAKWSLRDITEVFNRGDGILWDLIECAGERDATGQGSPTSQKRLIQRTMSSSMAQHSLKAQLQAALEQAKSQDKPDNSGNIAHVVMVAHSQGCLVLRLVLEELITTDCTGKIREAMLEKLCIFTFGNPSVDWKLELTAGFQPLNNPRQQKLEHKSLSYLSSHVLRTEHFANRVDFVAKLGVISEKKPIDSGYARDCVFVNIESDWIGHLFGTQYSLDNNHYKDEHATDYDRITGDKSWLLACVRGVTVADARRRGQTRKLQRDGLASQSPEIL